MRKIFFLAFISLGIVACEDVVDPSSVIQGEVDQTLFRSNAEAAFNNEGELVIQGSDVNIVTLKTNGDAVGMYEITPNSGNAATFVRDGVSYITSGPDTGGMIEIEEITNAYVTGNFFFEARRNGVGERLNFSKGVFYRIPFSSADAPGDDDVDEDDVFEANVNGSNFNPFNISAETTGGMITIIALSTTGEGISIFFPIPVEIGTYVIGEDDDFGGIYLTPNGAEEAVSGEIEITNFSEDNELAAGTFSFTTDEGTTVSNGEFIINF